MNWSVVHNNKESLRFGKFVPNVHSAVNELQLSIRCSTLGAEIYPRMLFISVVYIYIYYVSGSFHAYINHANSRYCIMTVCEAATYSREL